MTPFREHRLIHRNLADYEDPIKYNARNAAANAQAQQQQYSQNLATAQAGSAQVKAATEANFAAKKTISDLSSLYENGNFSGTADQMAELNDAQGKLNYTNKTLDAQSRIAANAADTSGQERLGEAQTVYQAASQGNQSSLQNGQTYNVGNGAIQNSAAQRLIDSGMSPDQVYKQMEKSQGQASQTMTTTGQGVQFDQNGNVIPGSGRMPAPISDRGMSRTTDTSTLTPITNAGVTETPQQFEQRKASVEQQNTEKMKQQQIAQEKGDQLKKFTAGVDPAPVEQTKTQIDTLLASISNLSPDLQAAVLPSLIGLQQSNNDITKEVNNIIGSQPTDEEIQANYGSLEKYIQSEDAKYKALIERNMQTSKEVATYNRDMLEAEKAIIEHDAAVAEQKQVIANAEGEKQLRRQLNRLGIQTDVQGLTYLQNEVQKGVDALENLKTANNLVSLKAQLAIGEGYRLEVKQAMETYEGNYLNITSQTTERLNAIKNSISTAKADRNKEIKEARKWGVEQKNANDRELRATISKANDTMASNLNMQRDDDRAQEQNGYQRLNWAIDTYGVNVPKALVDEISKMMPNVDVQSIISTPTAAALKASSGGSGGSNGYNFSFPSYLTQGTGEPPTFNSFLADKEKAALASGATNFDTSPAAMAGYRKEYDAKLDVATQYNPSAIAESFELRATAQNLSGPVYTRTKALVDNAIKSGDYAHAQAIVNNIGDDIPSAQSTSFENAISARAQVARLHDAMKAVGQIGPVTGLWKNLNPYDPAVVRVQNMITQTVPGLARGIFHEVGVLTDSDVARYTKTLENPNLTVQEAQNAYNDLMTTIDTNIQTKLKVWDAENKRTAGLKAIYNEPIPSSLQSNPQDDAKQAYLDSLPK